MTEGAPVEQQPALEIELEESSDVPVVDPQVLVPRHAHRQRKPDAWPRIQMPPVRVEHLDPLVPSVRDIDALLGVDGDPVHGVHLARPSVRASTRRAPVHQILAVPVELHDTRIDVAIADHEVTVREER